MEREIIRAFKETITYIVPATAIVLLQIYYKKTWIGILQTVSLFFGSIFSGVMFSGLTTVLLEVYFPEFMQEYGHRIDYFIVGFSVIVGFYILLFLFAKEEIFTIFNKLKKGK